MFKVSVTELKQNLATQSLHPKGFAGRFFFFNAEHLGFFSLSFPLVTATDTITKTDVWMFILGGKKISKIPPLSLTHIRTHKTFPKSSDAFRRKKFCLKTHPSFFSNDIRDYHVQVLFIFATAFLWLFYCFQHIYLYVSHRKGNWKWQLLRKHVAMPGMTCIIGAAGVASSTAHFYLTCKMIGCLGWWWITGVYATRPLASSQRK